MLPISSLVESTFSSKSESAIAATTAPAAAIKRKQQMMIIGVLNLLQNPGYSLPSVGVDASGAGALAPSSFLKNKL